MPLEDGIDAVTWSKIKDAYVADDETILDFNPAKTFRRHLRETKSWFIPGRTVNEDATKKALAPYEDLIFDAYKQVKKDLNLESYVELARTITGMEMSFIGLLTAESYCCVAQSGMVEDFGTQPRAKMLCDYTMAGPKNRSMKFRDIASDWRLENHPINTGTQPGSKRSYIGLPITTATGSNIGTICCLDTNPRNHGWTVEQENGLKNIALLIMRDLDLQVDRLLALQARNVFVASVNHELKTPIHGLLASAELLKAEASGARRLTSAEKDCIHSIFHCSNTLLDVIDNVLHFGADARIDQENGSRQKVDAGPLVETGLTSVNIVELVEQIAQSSWMGRMKHTNADLEIILKADMSHIAKRLWLNKGEFSRIVLNIIGNAIKYTNAGYVMVELEVIDKLVPEGQDVQHIVVKISDTGRGMPKAFIDSGDIFKPFVQRDDKAEGVGLGLSICKSFIAKCGGSMHVDSVLNAGTTMTMTFPFATDALFPEAMSRDASYQLLRGKTIALVTKTSSNTGVDRLLRSLIECCTLHFGMRETQTGNADVVITESDAILEDILHSNHNTRCLLVACEAKTFTSRKSNDVRARILQLPLGPVKLSQALLAILALTSMPNSRQVTPEGKSPMHLSTLPSTPQNSCGTKRKERASSDSESESDASARGHATNVNRQIEHSVDHKSLNVLPRVLCVDDNVINMRILTTVMSRVGVEFDTAADGIVAVSKYKAAHSPFDLIFLDLNMPKMGGLEACRIIRKHEEQVGLPRARIIALSAGGTAQAEVCREAGMDDYCDKPVSVKVLSDMVSNFQRPSSVAPG